MKEQRRLAAIVSAAHGFLGAQQSDSILGIPRGHPEKVGSSHE